MRFTLSALAIVAVSVVGCAKSEAQQERETNANLQIVGEKYIRSRLKDPTAAEFRNQFIGKKGAPCGEVNGKNGFGGFNGFERYIVVSKELAIMESDMKPGEFDTSWGEICR